MIQCNSFELVYLRKIPYLIPYGQQTANLQKSVRLNETGVLIYECCQDCLLCTSIRSESVTMVMKLLLIDWC